MRKLGGVHFGVLAAIALTACQKDQTRAQTLVPVLTRLSPVSARVGDAALTLTLSGTDFVDGAVVLWNNASRGTTFVNDHTLTASVLLSDLAIAGTANVAIFAPNTGTSNTLVFTVNNPAPILASLTPNAATVGDAGLTLVVTGAGFVRASLVQWNGSVRTTNFIDTNHLSATILSSDLAAPTTANVVVINGIPGGGTSASLPFSITGPVHVPLTPNLLALGADHSCAIRSGGVFCWGAGGSGQLGNNAASNTKLAVPVFGLGSGAQSITAGGAHTCAVVNGSARCWGAGSTGQLGNNATLSSNIPVQVAGLTAGVEAIAATKYGACAVVSGDVFCWGANNNGQLGNNSTLDSSVPVRVFGLPAGVETVVAGQLHACALAYGGVRCWGNGGPGQLGNGTSTDSHVPVSVVGMESGVDIIAAGGNHTCALVGGSARCWGDNSGDLGNNDYQSSSVPVQVLGLTSGVQAIAGEMWGTCAVVNGGAQCWGDGTHGALGNSAYARSPVPVHVFGLDRGVQAIAGGYAHACAMMVSGGVMCWGSGSVGQLGNNARFDSAVPVYVMGI